MTAPLDPPFQRLAAALAAEYEFLRLLGRGGMASVFLARELSLKRLVAIKVLDPELGASAVFRSRFEREAETAAQLQHPNIVPIYRVGEADRLAYFAMAYVEGESLAERLRREGALPLAEGLRIAREVAAALGAAHRRGIIHRDVKPQNVLLEKETGRVLVTDFGIARAPVAEDTPPDDEPLTAVGMVMGTPRYMSPEQASGSRDLTPASDLYALGVVTYEVLAGAYPYDAGSPPNYLMAHLTRPAIPLVTRVGDVPEEVEGTVHRMLEKDPARRFGTADEVREALGGAVSGTTGVPRARRRRRGLLVGAVAVLTAAVLGGTLLLRGDSGPPSGVDPRQSILIGFFDNTRREPDLDWLRLGGVELLSRALARWQDLQVVDPERLLDLARRANLEDGSTLSRDQLLDLARGAGVWTAASGAMVRLNDTLQITLRMYDVGSGRLLATASASAASEDQLAGAFGRLASQLLDVAGVAAGARLDVEPPTASIEAFRAFIDGLAARSRWEIDAAIAAFRRAIAADPRFALAYYELSQVMFVKEIASPEPTFVALADSAMRYAEGRPPKERLLIQAFHAMVHADMPRADTLYREVLARDSTVTDAWSGLATVALYDRTLRRDAQGREYLPASPTLALRSMEHALALDASDHRLYQGLAGILALAGFEENNTLPAYRDPPPGDIQTVEVRLPARTYTLLLVGDSLLAVPSESLGLRYPPAVVDSLRRQARVRAREVIDRWITVAPDEGQAFFLLSLIRRLDEDWDGSLRALAEAYRLGVANPVPFQAQRLAILLEAGRLAEAVRVGDSLDRAGYADGLKGNGALFGSSFINARLVGGRVTQAERLIEPFFSAIGAFAADPEVKVMMDFAKRQAPSRMAASVDRADRAAVARLSAELERMIASRKSTSGDPQWKSLAGAVMFMAASAGDTALVARWRARPEGEGRAAYAAFAATVAGDRASAEPLYEEAVRDTSQSTARHYALGRTAEGLGRREAALAHYTVIDTLTNSSINSPDADWLLVARSHALRGALAESLGDTALAGRSYRTFIELWRDADPALRPEVQRARRALAEMQRPDR